MKITQIQKRKIDERKSHPWRFPYKSYSREYEYKKIQCDM